MKGTQLNSEPIIYWYLLSVHLISVALTLYLSTFNLWGILVLPILVLIQRSEWRRYYFLSDQQSATHFTLNRNMTFDLYHQELSLGRWQTRSHFRLGSIVVCFLEPYSDIPLSQKLRINEKQSFLKRWRRNALLFSSKYSTLNAWKDLFRSQLIIISEEAVGRSRYRALLQMLIWKVQIE